MTRQCGECQLCCKLLPVVALDKLANQKCRHQKFGKGCAVYHRPGMPNECAIWNCRWIVSDDTADLSRPDRSHYVIDLMPDFITVRDDKTGNSFPVEVVQVWIDPKHRDAHRDPALRAYLLRRAAEGKAALIRYGSQDGFTLLAPSFCDDGKWHEAQGISEKRTHTASEIAEALSR